MQLNEKDMPHGIRMLPRDDGGFPIPAFVEYLEGGKRDFRVMSMTFWRECVQTQKCWICGLPITRNQPYVFTIGPMCALNRTTSEPPSHFDCAEYAARVCPFLSNPVMRRNEKNLPQHKEVAGIGLKRNPGGCVLWFTNDYELMPVHNGVLIQIGDPLDMIWYTRGRLATQEEALELINSGSKVLREVAAQDGKEGIVEFERYMERLLKLMESCTWPVEDGETPKRYLSLWEEKFGPYPNCPKCGVKFGVVQHKGWPRFICKEHGLFGCPIDIEAERLAAKRPGFGEKKEYTV